MATYYFLNTDSDADPDNSNNWWDAPSGGTNGYVPQTTDDIVVLAEMGGSVIVNNMIIEANFVGYATLSGTCTIQNGGYFGDGGEIAGNVICTTNGYIGINGNGGTIFGTLTFINNGSTDNITTCSVSNLNFSNNWTGSASYISVSTDVIYYYGFTGTASNLTISGATYYADYPTLYWNNAASDHDWSNINNWWVDVSCTQKSYAYATNQDVVMLASIYSPSGSAGCNDLTAGGSVQIVINLTVGGTATFNDTSSFGSISVSCTLSVYDAVMNDSSFNSSTITVSNVITLTDSSSNSGTIDGGGSAVLAYPLNRNTFYSGGITVSGGISYSGYPALFYFYGGSDWQTVGDWYIDSGHATNAEYYPGALDNVVIESNIDTTAMDVYAKNATITTTITLNSSYTFYITEGLTVNSGGQIGNGFTTTYVEANYAEFNSTSAIMGSAYLTTTAETDFNSSSSLNGGNVTAGSPGVRFYDTSTFSSGSVTGDVTIVSPNPLPFTVGGTYSGSLYYSGYSPRTIYFYHTTGGEDWGGSFWYSDAGHTTSTYAPIPAASLDNIIIEATVSSNMGSLDATVESLTVQNNACVDINITCNTAIFEDTSSFGSTVGPTLTQASGTVGIIFRDMSILRSTVAVTDTAANTPAVVLEDGATMLFGSYIDGDIEVYYPVTIPLGGTSDGIITYFNYPSYFNDATNNNLDGNWSTSSNWFLDSGNTISAGSPPTETYPGVNVILQTSVTTFNTGTPTAYDLSFGNSMLSIGGLSITVNGLATFEQGCHIDNTATIYGDTKFKNTGYNNGGTVTGSATFDLEAAEVMILYGYDGTYTGGEITFEYGKGVNGSSILGIV